MTHFDIFRGPFKADDHGSYIWCNDGQQVCFDILEYGHMIDQRIADCLNNEPDCKRFDNIGISDNGEYICDGHTPLLQVRGWGHLTGKGGLNLTGREAQDIQHEFVKWAAGELGYGLSKWECMEDTIKEYRKQLDTYNRLLEHLSENVEVLTESALECFCNCDYLEYKGYVDGVTERQGVNTFIRFKAPDEPGQHRAEWYENDKYGVWQVCEYEDTYHGYILLPQACDIKDTPRSDINRYFCIYYSC